MGVKRGNDVLILLRDAEVEERISRGSVSVSS